MYLLSRGPGLLLSWVLSSPFPGRFGWSFFFQLLFFLRGFGNVLSFARLGRAFRTFPPAIRSRVSSLPFPFPYGGVRFSPFGRLMGPPHRPFLKMRCSFPGRDFGGGDLETAFPPFSFFLSFWRVLFFPFEDVLLSLKEILPGPSVGLGRSDRDLPPSHWLFWTILFLTLGPPPFSSRDAEAFVSFWQRACTSLHFQRGFFSPTNRLFVCPSFPYAGSSPFSN